ncbi:cytochrome P450 [Amycolatopsis bartoniae]|uniref:Cytochrome P450 n=1 Tax=Amycolatopsis bartoniae TaxID=941986 RepID=A0A8H9IU92_9PSEU|nr:cytochrome P450 [Amycolatopsis bartoniae]MBB2934317.1 cytochrome P450 [Amycolatopsis bartoniae]TVT00127.1 cytochrome P450 [Amycolatopsis bartoniae]GHF48229.1 cytochrome P450 [Amycolatopsis bartoniae]
MTRADVFDPRVFARGLPHEEFRRLRDTEPVSWQEEHEVLGWPAGPGYWAVTRYADVKHVLRTPEVYSSWLGATQIRDPEPDDLAFIRRMILNMDPPEHNRLRRIVAAVFTRRRLERFTDLIAERARNLLGAVDGRCDLPADVTDDFPLLNLADLLGVPPGDRGLLLKWTNRVIGYQDPEHAEIVRDEQGKPVNPRSPAMLADMFAYAQQLAAEKRARPADDLMTALVHAEVDGRALDDAELQMFFFLVVIAGNDTVRSALPGGVLALVEHPGEYRRLRADPALLPGAVEEMLRWHPPVLTFRRTAARDTELGGQRIRAGDKVVVYFASAHFDERAFPDPYRFDVTREPNEHLAFGQGPHLCLGAHFGRLQLRIFFREFLRLPEVSLDGEVRHLTSNFINGITHLPLRW